MALTNTTTRYGGITKTFHWLTALLILTLIPLGWYAGQLPYETSEELTRKAWFFSIHKTLGVTAFFVALARIFWALSQPKPGLLNADKRAESFAAELVHWLLYGALVILPLSGWISHAAAEGFAPILWPFGQGLPLVPKSPEVEHVFAAIHWIAARLLILSILLHFTGAMKHHLIDRDATLRRMLPGETAVGPLPAQKESAVPMGVASVLWLAALAFGATMALQDKDVAHAAAPALEEVRSQWQVEEGQIEISVVQFGNTVKGSFADWTAEISYDETVPQGKRGEVLTTISIPSLTLGSVTQQALGADFFDAPNHPTATFEADIMTASDNLAAIGTLTIKDKAIPLTLPFALAINDGVAEMRGTVQLDRRDFGIGDNMADEQNLGFAVDVLITLLAKRAQE